MPISIEEWNFYSTMREKLTFMSIFPIKLFSQSPHNNVWVSISQIYAIFCVPWSPWKVCLGSINKRRHKFFKILTPSLFVIKRLYLQEPPLKITSIFDIPPPRPLAQNKISCLIFSVHYQNFTSNFMGFLMPFFRQNLHLFTDKTYHVFTSKGGNKSSRYLSYDQPPPPDWLRLLWTALSNRIAKYCWKIFKAKGENPYRTCSVLHFSMISLQKSGTLIIKEKDILGFVNF